MQVSETLRFNTRLASVLAIVGMLLSLLGAAQFSAPSAGAAGTEFRNVARMPGVAVGADGMLHTIYVDYDSSLPFYKKLDGGWGAAEAELRLGDEKADTPVPQIVVDGSGNVHVAWTMVYRYETNPATGANESYRAVFYQKRAANGTWSPREQVSHNLTGPGAGKPRRNHDSPSLAVDSSGVPYVAWQGGESGTDGTVEVYERKRPAGGFTQYSDASPFCVTCAASGRAFNPQYANAAGGAVHLTFIQGNAPTQFVYYSRRDGSDKTIRQITSTGKALQAQVTAYNEKLYAAWRDGEVDADKKIRISESTDSTGATWNTVGALDDRSGDPENPHIIAAGGRLHAVWNDSYGSGKVFHGYAGSTASDVNSWVVEEVNSNGKNSTFTMDGAGNAYIVWTSYDSDRGVAGRKWNASTLTLEGGTPPPPPDCGAWSCWASRGGILSDSPAAATFNGRAYVFAKGSDNALYVKSTTDGANYSEWMNLGGILTAAPAAATLGGRIYVFAKGSDNALYVKSSSDGVNFNDWASLGGVLTAAPAAASAGGALYVFAKGADDQLYVKISRDGNNFGDWDVLGGILTAAPAAAGFDGSIFVYAKGSDNALYVRRLTAGRPSSDWMSLGGILTAAPAAAVADGEVYVFANGSDNGLYYKTSPNGLAYGEWVALGGTLKAGSTPAAAGVGNRIFAFVRWADDALWERHSPE